MKYTLQSPLTIANETTTEIIFRDEFTCNDMRDVKISELSDPTPAVICKIASRLSGKPEAILLRMAAADYFEVAQIIGGFYGAGRKTGTDASGS